MKKNKNAFTLIELILGLSIFSIISLCLYGVFSGGIQVNRKSKNQNDFYREIRMSFSLMEKELENMVSYGFSAARYEDKSSFMGSDNQISFINAKS